MTDARLFENQPLLGGFIVVRVDVNTEQLIDALGREAIARTRITGRDLSLTIKADLSDKEFSVTIYHEILEALTVASAAPPNSVMEFVESDFEREAYAAHERFGPASPKNLNLMLQSFGFS